MGVRTVKLYIGLAGCFLAAASLCLASEVPPPEHVKIMKDLGGQMGAIRKGVDVEKNASAMVAACEQTAEWWKKRNSDVANKAASDAVAGAKALLEAAKAGNQQGVMAGMKMTGAGCKGCHDQHREKISDTEYKIK